MRIRIKATNINLTKSLVSFIENKLLSLNKYIKRFEKSGETLMYLEVAKTTEHHNKGEILRAEATINIQGKSIRADSKNEDLRTAIRELRDILKRDFMKTKNKLISTDKRHNRPGKPMENL